jgi:arabinogalactan endo-1,4-beta-galactosidase
MSQHGRRNLITYSVNKFGQEIGTGCFAWIGAWIPMTSVDMFQCPQQERQSQRVFSLSLLLMP